MSTIQTHEDKDNSGNPNDNKMPKFGNHGETSAPSKIPELSEKDRASEFKKNDKIVKNSLGSFQAAGAALATIKKDSLWKAVIGGTWEKYSRSVGLCSVQANRLIMAAQVNLMIVDAAKSGPLPTIRFPKSEWQIRPLTKEMSDGDRFSSWTLALEIAKDQDPTGKEVSAAVIQILGKEPKKKPEKKPDLAGMINDLLCTIRDRETDGGSVSFEMVELKLEAILLAIG